MTSIRTITRSALRGFISAKAALVLAIIAGGGGLLAYEWHHAHSAKGHHVFAGGHHAFNSGHHHRPHEARTAAN